LPLDKALHVNASSARWAYREWPDGTVVYDRTSGATHALAPLTAEVLALPESKRYDLRVASEAIASSLSQPLSPELTASVGEALDQLRRIELI